MIFSNLFYKKAYLLILAKTFFSKASILRNFTLETIYLWFINESIEKRFYWDFNFLKCLR
jgi:hypothetical protein